MSSGAFPAAIDDYPDLRTVDSPPTRKDERLDLFITNLAPEATLDVRLMPPLESNDGEKKSDHSSLFLSATFENSDRFTKRIYWTRPMTKGGLNKFNNWIRNFGWRDVYETVDPDKLSLIHI